MESEVRGASMAPLSEKRSAAGAIEVAVLEGW